MSGKTNLTFTNYSAKKLLSKGHTSLGATDNEEVIGSAVQVAAQSIFATTIPGSPSKTLNTVQAGAVEYVEFDLTPINASYFDANTYDAEASAQSAGYHAYAFSLKSSYQTDTDNNNAGNGSFVNSMTLTGTLGALQIVNPSFSTNSPNPYMCSIYSGSRDLEDQITLTDELDWYVDYYNGILYVQDVDSGKIPTRAKAFIYVGDMLSAKIGGGGSGTGVGWIGSGIGAISTTGSLFIGTNGATAAGSDIYLSNTGGARFNEQGLDSDFKIKSVNKENIFKIDADQDRVLILSGGSTTSVDEAIAPDVSFYVSGSTTGKDTTTGGVALFGGDVVISGSLYDKDGNVISGGGGGGSPGGANTQIQFNDGGSFGASSAFTFTGTEVELSAASPKYTLRRASQSESSTLSFEGSSAVVGSSISHEGLTNDLVFKTFGNSGASLEEILRLGGYYSGDNRQVVFLSGSDIAASDMQPHQSKDIAFFVSGAIDSRGTDTKGTAVFGGDVVVSGTLSINRSDAGGYSMVTVTTDGKVGIGTDSPANKLSVGGNMDLGEYLYHKNDTDTYIQFTDDMIQMAAGGRTFIKMEEAGQDKLIINHGALDIDLKVGGENNVNLIRTDAANDSVYFGAGSGSGNDNSFWVSGSIGSKGTSTRGTSVFGGDVVISGSLYDSSGNLIGAGSTADADGDTKIQVEKSADEDKIRFDTAGSERMIIDDSGNVGLGLSNPQKQVHIYNNLTSSLRIGAQGSSEQNDTLLEFCEQTDVSGDMTYGFSQGYDSTKNHFVLKNHNNSADGRETWTMTRTGGKHFFGVSVDDAAGNFLGTDNYFFVSGAINSKGTSNIGTSVFGGDVVASGSLSVLNPGTIIHVSASMGTTGSEAGSTIDGTYSYHVNGGKPLILRSEIGGNTTQTRRGAVMLALEHKRFSSSDTNQFDVPDAMSIDWNFLPTRNYPQTRIQSECMGNGRYGLVFYASNTNSSDRHRKPDNYHIQDADGKYPGFKRQMAIGPDSVKIGFDASDDYDSHTYANAKAALHFCNNSTMHGFLAPDGTTPGTGHPDKIWSGAGYNNVFQSGIDIGSGRAAFLCSTNDGKMYIGGRQIIMSASNGLGMHIGTTGSNGGPIIFGTDDISRMSIDTSGNVAIGAVNPSKYFEIKSTSTSNQVFILSGSGAAASPNESNYTDTNFFVSGSIGSKDSSEKGTSLFGGDVVISGTLYDGAGNTIGGGVNYTGGIGSNNQMITADGSGNIVAESNITFNGSTLNVSGDILPGGDRLYNLGGPNNRFANIYTGDLHLKNERGHWQIVEEADALTVINCLTNKRYKMVLEPYDDNDEKKNKA